MKRNGILAGMAVAILLSVSGLALANGPTATSSSSSSGSSSTPATYPYVNGAVMPLAKSFIQSFKSAKRILSKRKGRFETLTFERNAAGILRDNLRTIHLGFRINARVKGDRLSYGPQYAPTGAQYSADAYFKGSVKPKNLVELWLWKIASAHRYYDRNMAISLGKTIYPGPFGIETDKLWTVDTWIGKRGDRRYDSCTVEGDRGYNPLLSTSVADAVIRESVKLLKHALDRRPLVRQMNVFAGLKKADRCPWPR